jgi:hypothetical protein
MIEGLKPYAEYKESGQKWLGRVPKHWGLLPNRALFEEVKDRNHPSDEMLSVTITRGIIRQERIAGSFLLLLLQGRLFAEYIAPIFTGISVPHLSPEQIKGFTVMLPPVAEQKEIVAFSTKKTRHLATAISRTEREIALMADLSDHSSGPSYESEMSDLSDETNEPTLEAEP